MTAPSNWTVRREPTSLALRLRQVRLASLPGALDGRCRPGIWWRLHGPPLAADPAARGDRCGEGGECGWTAGKGHAVRNAAVWGCEHHDQHAERQRHGPCQRNRVPKLPQAELEDATHPAVGSTSRCQPRRSLGRSRRRSAGRRRLVVLRGALPRPGPQRHGHSNSQDQDGDAVQHPVSLLGSEPAGPHATALGRDTHPDRARAARSLSFVRVHQPGRGGTSMRSITVTARTLLVVVTTALAVGACGDPPADASPILTLRRSTRAG